MIKLGTVLANVSETEGMTREQWKSEFELRVTGHKDENLLLACLKEACRGKHYIVLESPPPANLEVEGFRLEKEQKTGRLLYHFE